MQNPHAPTNLDKTVEIISIGNELLVGQVLDTNTHWLVRALTGIGAHVRRAGMIRDDYNDIIGELRAAVARGPRLIVTTGGLGPTDDDLTLRAISLAFDLPLREDAQALQWVTERYAHLATIRPNFSAEINASRRKMAQFPAGTRPLHNPSGAAPAMAWNPAPETLLVALPGVPSEMKDIFATSLQTELAASIGTGGYIERSIVLETGDESRLAHVLQDVQARFPTVYVKSRGQDFADGRRLTVVLSCGGPDLAALRALVRETESAAVDGLKELGYVVLRVVGDALD
jgi:molybdenum cofactor synthesis domain-containing protein